MNFTATMMMLAKMWGPLPVSEKTAPPMHSHICKCERPGCHSAPRAAITYHSR